MAKRARRAKRAAPPPRTRSPKAPRPPRESVMSGQARRRMKRASGLRHGATITQGTVRPREVRGVTKAKVRKR